eukprot:5154225-Prymnesium_polylepis.1
MDVRVVGGEQSADNKWSFARQGSTSVSVPCACFAGSCYVLLHPPMRRNGNGLHLNQYTLTMQVRFGKGSHDESEAETIIFPRGLMATGGWDDVCPAVEGALPAQLLMDENGGLGAHEVFGHGGGACVRRETWQTITCAVDTVAGVMTTYVDGEL